VISPGFGSLREGGIILARRSSHAGAYRKDGFLG
jgi:hypothetical protein